MRRQFIPRGSVYLLVLVPASDVSAQVTTGTIQGQVSDTTGAVMPNAQVTATNIETNFSRNATTDEAGQYSIQFLPPGKYTVEASAPGFKKFLQTGVVVEIYRNARLDPALEPGSVSETVTISSDPRRWLDDFCRPGQTVNNQDFSTCLCGPGVLLLLARRLELILPLKAPPRLPGPRDARERRSKPDRLLNITGRRQQYHRERNTCNVVPSLRGARFFA